MVLCPMAEWYTFMKPQEMVGSLRTRFEVFGDDIVPYGGKVHFHEPSCSASGGDDLKLAEML